MCPAIHINARQLPRQLAGSAGIMPNLAPVTVTAIADGGAGRNFRLIVPPVAFQK
jgi:hypothetical protein